jgi:hypothetical protein
VLGANVLGANVLGDREENWRADPESVYDFLFGELSGSRDPTVLLSHPLTTQLAAGPSPITINPPAVDQSGTDEQIDLAWEGFELGDWLRE